MEATIPLDLQRAELEQVLQSGLFAKAPRLERFLRYVCERHFDDDSDQLKEYSIALEALGRSADFDPKKDSIVRVEAHRLRKRLAEYYAGPGAGHLVHIEIPNGQYRPQFLQKTEQPAARECPVLEPVLVKELTPVEVPPALPAAASQWRWLWPVLLAFVGAVLVAGGLLRRPSHAAIARTPGLPQPLAEIWNESQAAEGLTGEIRMLAGYHGAPLVDHRGQKWMPDAFYKGGVSALVGPEHLPKTQPDAQFIKAQRSGAFEYNIPLRACTYELHLYLIETEYGPGNPKGGDASSRTFQVSVNGQPKLDGLDPLAEAGAPDRLYERVLKDISPDKDGQLHLAFAPITGPAFLNAIRLVPSPPGRMHPVRIVAQGSPLTDSDGRLWAADEYFLGGNSVFRKNVVVNGEEGLYQGERYGNFSYRIPVAPGRYRVKLHFAETWFGTPESHVNAFGHRVFDVYANGVALLRNYEIAKAAGGADRSVEKVFENVQPNAQGMLLLEFVPVKNYAEVNAIEIVETG